MNGKIVGYTNDGKPVYENHKHPSHLDFSAKEHDEAAKIQTKLAHSAYSRMFAAEDNMDKAELKAAQDQVNLHGWARNFHLVRGTVNTNPDNARIGFSYTDH